MSTLISGYITLEKLEQIIATVKKKGEKGFKFTASISERSNQYGQNIVDNYRFVLTINHDSSHPNFQIQIQINSSTTSSIRRQSIFLSPQYYAFVRVDFLPNNW